MPIPIVSNNHIITKTITMKKLFLLLFSLILFASCGNDLLNSKVAITSSEFDIKDPQLGDGMVINVHYKIVGELDSKYMCVVAFADADGNLLKDKNSTYCYGGIVGTSCDIKPKETNGGYLPDSDGDIILFIPYKELHIPLSRPIELKAAALILNSFNEEVAHSDPSSFTIR